MARHSYIKLTISWHIPYIAISWNDFTLFIVNNMSDNKKTHATLFMRISKFDNASACWSCLSEGRILTKDSNNTSSAWIKCHTHCCSKDSHSRVLSGYKWNQHMIKNTFIILTIKLNCTNLQKQRKNAFPKTAARVKKKNQFGSYFNVRLAGVKTK